MTKEEFYSRALSFDEVGEQVDIFKKEKIKYEQEIERLNNIINEIKKENKQLKANWDKLKEWLESNWEESQDIWFVKIIYKMQEIEQGSDK